MCCQAFCVPFVSNKIGRTLNFLHRQTSCFPLCCSEQNRPHWNNQNYKDNIYFLLGIIHCATTTALEKENFYKIFRYIEEGGYGCIKRCTYQLKKKADWSKFGRTSLSNYRTQENDNLVERTIWKQESSENTIFLYLHQVELIGNLTKIRNYKIKFIFFSVEKKWIIAVPKITENKYISRKIKYQSFCISVSYFKWIYKLILIVQTDDRTQNMCQHHIHTTKQHIEVI